jgi:hypothetical protein
VLERFSSQNPTRSPSYAVRASLREAAGPVSLWKRVLTQYSNLQLYVETYLFSTKLSTAFVKTPIKALPPTVTTKYSTFVELLYPDRLSLYIQYLDHPDSVELG